MKVYFDTEYTGLYKDCNLITIGLISEDGKEFYAEIDDDKLLFVDDWIEENVLANTVRYGDKVSTDIVLDEKDYHIGSKEQIKEELKTWLSQFDYVQLVSDVCHYDMTLIIDLFGTAFDLPNNVSPYCHDINQDIADYYNITDSSAFNLNREDILLNTFGINMTGDKHNSMYDARVIKAIYNNLRKEDWI